MRTPISAVSTASSSSTRPHTGRGGTSIRPARGPWVCGATLCFTKAFWSRHCFPEVAAGEDTQFVFAKDARILALPDENLFVGTIHSNNTSPKRMRDPRWRPCSVATVEALMREERRVPAHERPAALVGAGGGLGDIIRITPLVQVLDGLGYTVDLLLAPDDPAIVELLRGAPELRHVALCRTAAARTDAPAEVREENYALAALTAWSPPIAGAIRAERALRVSRREWLTQGDPGCIEAIARELGWTGPLPAPFVRTSGRDFGLPAGMIALHPGCKPNWPWKKWHGFDELARLLPDVAIVGTSSDLDNSNTYFKRAFEWPAHARNFVGKLNLPDTAAVIGQCAALVTNDSGLMHLGGALGVQTFGIFGITSPARELGPSSAVTPISNGLPCEPDCRRAPWGRRDCDRHLQCLKTLTAQEVLTRMHAVLPKLVKLSETSPRPSGAVAALNLNYYGNVFDASGYGQAARAYVHALYKAGVNVSVVDTGVRPPQVHDPLVASLLGQNGRADFNLLHGIPSTWGAWARRLPNVIAMTVWETDSMPPQWLDPLSRAIDVWLPCRFNVDVFSRSLPRRAFTLPHPIPPRASASADAALAPALARISPDDSFTAFSNGRTARTPPASSKRSGALFRTCETPFWC
jgi:hypothetical protein